MFLRDIGVMHPKRPHPTPFRHFISSAIDSLSSLRILSNCYYTKVDYIMITYVSTFLTDGTGKSRLDNSIYNKAEGIPVAG